MVLGLSKLENGAFAIVNEYSDEGFGFERAMM